MERKKVFSNDYYVISDDFRLLSFNDSVAENYKDIKVGDYCYKATMKRDTPCLHCPIAGNTDSDSPVYWDPFYNSWIEAIFTKISDGKYGVICRHVDDRGLNAFDNLAKKDNELLIRKVSGHAINEQIIEKENELNETTEIISNAGYGIWTISLEPNGNKMTVNDTLKKICGISQMNFTPEELYDYLHRRAVGDYKEVEENDYKAMMDGQIVSNLFAWNHPTKGKIYLRAGGTCYIRPNGQKVISGYCGDVSEQKYNDDVLQAKLKDALELAESANKAKTVFLNNMSHDIRTPMNAILGFTGLMEKVKDNPDFVSAYIDKIRRSGDYLLTIINNVLEMARIDSGVVDLEESVVELWKEEDSFLLLFEEDIRNKEITVETSMNVIHRYIIADSTKIRQIMVNLMSNAIKYTPKGGKIKMDVTEYPCGREGYGRFVSTISDNGIGMSKEYLEKIFEAFSREHNTTESKVYGTGLGMSIVKKLVDCLGGEIEVESEEGKGTTFRLTLEHKIEEHPEKIITEQNISYVQNPILKGKRVLLVEDNELNAEIAIAILEGFGMKVERAEDGVVCIDMVSRVNPGYYDIILMDIQMPNMNGYETTQRIRNLPEIGKAAIPIIAMTANAFAEDKKSALDAGMNEHIAKPIDVEELAKILVMVLDNYTLEKAKKL